MAQESVLSNFAPFGDVGWEVLIYKVAVVQQKNIEFVASSTSNFATGCLQPKIELYGHRHTKMTLIKKSFGVLKKMLFLS